MPEEAARGLQRAGLDRQRLGGPSGTEASLPWRGVGVQHVAQEGSEVVEDGEDAGDAADAAHEACGEVVSCSLEVAVGVLVEFGGGAASSDSL